jgi:hypothetical protein
MPNDWIVQVTESVIKLTTNINYYYYDNNNVDKLFKNNLPFSYIKEWRKYVSRDWCN